MLYRVAGIAVLITVVAGLCAGIVPSAWPGRASASTAGSQLDDAVMVPGPPSPVLLANPGLCLVLGSPPPPGCFNTYGLEFNLAPGVFGGDGELLNVADELGNNNGVIEPSDFAQVAALTAGQLHQEDGAASNSLSELAVIAFVSNQGPVTFHTGAGFFGENGQTAWTCDGSTSGPDPDSDCGGPFASNASPHFAPDHVVVAYLRCTSATCPTLGTQELTVEQAGFTSTVNFTVVGEPVKVEFNIPGGTIQAGVAVGPLGPLCSGDFMDGSTPDPAKSYVLARALDAAGTAVTGAWLTWSVDDQSRAAVAFPVGPTMDLGGIGIGAPNFICALQGAPSGAVTLTARLIRQYVGLAFDPFADPTQSDPGSLAAATVTFNVEPPSPTATATDTATSTPTVTPTPTSSPIPPAPGGPVANATPSPVATRTATPAAIVTQASAGRMTSVTATTKSTVLGVQAPPAATETRRLPRSGSRPDHNDTTALLVAFISGAIGIAMVTGVGIARRCQD